MNTMSSAAHSLDRTAGGRTIRIKIGTARLIRLAVPTARDCSLIQTYIDPCVFPPGSQYSHDRLRIKCLPKLSKWVNVNYTALECRTVW